MSRWLSICCAVVLLSAVRPGYGVETIIVWDRLQDNPVAYQILKIALDNTITEYGPYQLQSSIPMEQGRVALELEKNRLVQIASFAPDERRESNLLPVRIPVTQGLLGYRVCLIKSGTQQRFNDINNLQQFNASKIRVGQGEHWPDTAILRDNNIAVVSSVKYKNLFKMLKMQRFDCFARSISEIMPEADKYRSQGLEVEKNLLLAYRLPTFFFISKKNPQLQARLRMGLKRGLANGSISKYIQEHYKNDFARLHLQGRKVINLVNKNFTGATKKEMDDFRYWFDPFRSTLR